MAKTLFIAICNQKGGEGKTLFTVLLSSFFHYKFGEEVGVLDCDYSQYSLWALKEREKIIINADPWYQKKIEDQFSQIEKEKAYKIEKSTPENAIQDAIRIYLDSEIHYDTVFFDLPGTMNSVGVLNTILNMDYIFVPIVTDHLVMDSSLKFAAAVTGYKKMHPEVKLKQICFFWNKLKTRENKDLYHKYSRIIKQAGIQVLHTEIADSTKYKQEISETHRPVFRSTFFLPDKKLLKGSNVEELIQEIRTIIKPVKDEQ